jgi:O-Antigen ligase
MEGLAIVLGIAAVAWGALLLLRGGILGGCLAVLVTGCCLGYPFFNIPTKPLPLTVDRVLWAVLIVQYVIWRRLGWADPKPLGKAEFLLLAFVGLLTLSALGHDWQSHHDLAASRVTFFYVMPLGLYWTARQSRLSERAVLVVLACLTGFGVYLGITALGEVANAPWLVFPRYVMSPKYAEFLGRARGPLLNPIGNGIVLGTCLAAGSLLWGRVTRWGKLAMLPLLLLMASGVFLTLTRSVWMGAGLGLIVVVGIASPPGWRRLSLALAAVAVVLLVSTEWQRLWSFKRDRNLSARQAAESVKLRPILATVAWKMFLDRPIWGCGFGHYVDASKEYFSDRSTELPLEKARPFVQHNVFLSLLTETGLVGMGLFVALLGCWVRDARRLWRTPQAPASARHLALVFMALMAGYVVNGTFHDVSIIPMVNMFLFFLAGAMEGLRASRAS